MTKSEELIYKTAAKRKTVTIDQAAHATLAGGIGGAAMGAAMAHPKSRKAITTALNTPVKKTLSKLNLYKYKMSELPAKKVDQILVVYNHIYKTSKGSSAIRSKKASDHIQKTFKLRKTDMKGFKKTASWANGIIDTFEKEAAKKKKKKTNAKKGAAIGAAAGVAETVRELKNIKKPKTQTALKKLWASEDDAIKWTMRKLFTRKKTKVGPIIHRGALKATKALKVSTAGVAIALGAGIGALVGKGIKKEASKADKAKHVWEAFAMGLKDSSTATAVRKATAKKNVKGGEFTKAVKRLGIDIKETSNRWLNKKVSNIEDPAVGLAYKLGRQTDKGVAAAALTSVVANKTSNRTISKMKKERR